MKDRIVSRIALAILLALGLMGPSGTAPHALAQSKGDPASGMLQYPVNFQINQEESKAFASMRKGEAPVTGSEDKKVIDDAAKWYAYRFTYLEYQQPKAGIKGMHELIVEAKKQILDPKKIKGLPQQQAFADEFGKAFTMRLREVANTDKVIARMNAAMLLADLARTGLEVAADPLAEILSKAQESDAVKYWAVRGLHDIFALEPGAGGNVDVFQDKEREARCIQALLDYLNAKSKLARELHADEAQAMNMVRRDTVKALGQTRYPAFAKLVGKKHVLERTTALALTRVVAMDGLVPEPSLDERLFAAMALCNLQPTLCKEYHADYPGYYTGRFVVDFIKRYNNEKGEKREPWKLDAAMLIKALEKLRTTLEGPPADKSFKYVRKITALSDTLLRDVVEGKLNPSPTDLNDWLDKNPPSSASVYEDLPSAVVHGGQVAAHR